MADYPVERAVGKINLAGGCIVQSVPSLSGVQSTSGAAALSVAQYSTHATSTATGNVLTLADGVSVGQRKRVSHTVVAGTLVVTPAAAAFTHVTLATVSEFVELVWNGSVWNIAEIGNTVTGGATLMPVVV